MAIEITFFGGRPRDNNASVVDALGEQVGNTVAVANATVSAAFPISGLCRVMAISASRVRFGENPANATGGEYWPAGHSEIRAITAGRKVAVDAG